MSIKTSLRHWSILPKSSYQNPKSFIYNYYYNEVRIEINSNIARGAICSFLGLTERILGFIDGLERITRKSVYLLNEVESNKVVRSNNL